jgi:Xaa-Pro aminopeptidase
MSRLATSKLEQARELIRGHGYLGIEEMVRMTEDGCEWLTERQRAMPILPTSTE